jgi:uncharacterized protein YjbJ (UPF0337 family)
MGDIDKPGSIDEAKGRVREAYGDLTGDKEQKRKGIADKVSGKIKEGAETLREKAHELFDRTKK